MTPVAELHINLLGPPQLTWRGEPFAVARRQVRGLLFYLAYAAEGGEQLDWDRRSRRSLSRAAPAPRDRLAYLFWPDLPDHDARAHLKRLLSILRSALPDASLLLADHGAVGLDPTRLWCDATAFARLTAAPDPGSWTQAVAIYRGPFLDGFSLPDSPEYGDWQAQVQAQLERRCLAALAGLVDARRAAGELDAAIEYARRALALDELAEAMHRRLIELYAARGERNAAARQFEQCVMILERELGVKPLPETRAAYEAAIAARAPQPPLPPRWTVLPSLDLPLVGRTDALQTLTRAYRRLHAGGLILVSGEPGIGKSRLMQTFAHTSNVTVLASGSPPGGETSPYSAVSEALRQALAWPGRWQGIRPIWLAEAGRLLPELAEVFPDLPQPVAVAPAQAQARLFEALSRCFLGLASQGPLLLCLDDLHWADPATLGWLAALPRWLDGSRICLLASCRPAQADVLADVKRAFARPGRLAEIELARLSAGDVAVLLAHLPQAPADPHAVAAAIHAATGGNAFFVLETVRALLETGRLADPPERLPLVGTVQAAIQRRLERLSPLGRQVLETAAVLAPDLALDLLAQTAGRSGLEAAQGLDELARRQLLEGGETQRFSHDLVRQAVYDQISPWRRRILHRRAAEALDGARPPRGDPAWAAVAGHYDRAGDAAEAIRCLVLAASAAQRLHAHQEAIGHARRALALSAQAPPPPEQLARLHETLGDSLLVRGQHAAAEEAFAAALALTPVGDRLAQASRHGKVAATLQARLLMAEAEAASDRALAALGDPAGEWPPSAAASASSVEPSSVEPSSVEPSSVEAWQRAWLELQLARMQILYSKGDLDALARLVGAVEPAVAAAGSPAYRADFVTGLIDVAVRREHFTLSAGTVTATETLLAAAQETGDPARLAWGWFGLGFARLWAGQLGAAAAPLLTGLRQAQELGLAHTEVVCLTYLSCTYRFLGDAVEARRFAERSLAVTRQVDMPIYRGTAHANLAALRWRERLVDAAQAEAERALALWGDHPYPFRWLAGWVLLAVHAARGDMARAVAQAQAILHPSQRRQPGDLPALLENAVRAWPEHPAEARAALRRAMELAQGEGYV